jgi:hypothetical protein
MKYVMSWGLPFIQPQFTSLNYTSLYFASLHFTAFSMIPPSLRLIYHFPNPFPKITWFTGGSPQNICRYLVPELDGPIYKGQIHNTSQVNRGLIEGFYEPIDLWRRCLFLFGFSVRTAFLNCICCGVSNGRGWQWVTNWTEFEKKSSRSILT